MHHEFCRRHDGRVRGGDSSGSLNRKQSAGTGVLRTYASWRCSRRCSSCRRRRNRQTWRQQLPSYVTKDGLFCCSSSACNPYDMLTSSKSHIAHSITTHLQQCSPIVLGLTLSRTRNVIIRLWPEQCRGCSLLDIMEAGRNKCIMLLPPAWFYFGPAAWCNECILYSPIFGGLPQAQRGKHNARREIPVSQKLAQ